jgi:hypothetical protein
MNESQNQLSDKNQILIVLSPTFSNRLNKNDYPVSIEFIDLPVDVQKEVIDYFRSDEFIGYQVQDYVLNEIQINYDTYPKFNGIVDSITFNLYNEMLIVYLFVSLIQIQGKIYDTTHYEPVTFKDFDDTAKDMFWRASHSGPLIHKYGKYLGEDYGKYMIYLNYKRTNSYIIK